MKKLSILTLALIFAISLQAQQFTPRGPGYGMANPANTALKLTEDQNSAIQALRTEKLAEITKLNNLQRELKAQLITLKQTDKPDVKAINAKIDQLTELQNKRLKLNAQHEMKVRALLTDEQKVEWDARKSRNFARRPRGGNRANAMGGRYSNNKQGAARNMTVITRGVQGSRAGREYGPGYRNSATVIEQ